MSREGNLHKAHQKSREVSLHKINQRCAEKEACHKPKKRKGGWNTRDRPPTKSKMKSRRTGPGTA